MLQQPVSVLPAVYSVGEGSQVYLSKGNLQYRYFAPLDDPETVLLIDSWTSQEAIDAHHATPMMQTIAALREKYDLHMSAERYFRAGEDVPASDETFIRK